MLIGAEGKGIRATHEEDEWELVLLLVTGSADEVDKDAKRASQMRNVLSNDEVTITSSLDHRICSTEAV
jgi:hypothetical protein